MGFPLFLDFEASLLGPKSYPIEVAWSNADGKVRIAPDQSLLL